MDPSKSTPSTEALQFVKSALGEIIQEFPQQIQDSLYEKFCEEYDSPMTSRLETVLRKRLTDAEVRHLMFSPTPAQYRHYPALVSLRPAGADANQLWPQMLQKQFMTLFYLKHARNWDLVVEFVLLDGLHVLADMFLHRDFQIRGQAIDAFVQITSNPSFDWFNDPVGYQGKVLHSKMIGLAGSPFLRNLVQNVQLCDPKQTAQSEEESTSRHQTRLPGGTHVLLQVLAFFLSWVRKFYTQPRNELRLSRALLDLLRDWRDRTQSQEPAELELARQVYDDFSRWPAIEDSLASSQQDNHDLISANGETDSADGKKSYFSRELVKQLLADDSEGKLERESKAIDLCSGAIAASTCLLDAHLLRARALVQLLERRASEEKPRRSTDLHSDIQRCLGDCAVVLEVDQSNIDAWKYRLRVFAAMAMWAEAQALLDEWFSSSGEELGSRFLPEDVEFFRAQREVATENNRAKAEIEAQQERLHAMKQAKQEEIFQAILQRGNANKAVQALLHREAKAKPCELHERKDGKCARAGSASAASAPQPLSKAEASSSILSKVAASGSKTKAKSARKPESVKDLQLELLCRGHSFVRKFRQVKSDPAALEELLLETPLQALSDAFSVSLGENNFLSIFDALVQVRRSGGAGDVEKATQILSLLLSTPRFEFYLEMASKDVQEKVRVGADETVQQPPLQQTTSRAKCTTPSDEIVPRTDNVQDLRAGSACA